MTDLERMLLVGLRAQESMEKVAGWGEVALGGGLTLAGVLGAGVLTAINRKKSARRLAIQQDESWNRLISKYPEFKNDNEARSNFDAIFSVAPSVGSIPQYVAPIMRQAKTYGTEGLPLEIAKGLKEIDWRDAQTQEIRDRIPTSLNVARGIGVGAADAAARSTVDRAIRSVAD